jgi:hypothetical protein
MEQELKRMFEMKETEMTVPPTLSPALRNRVRRQRMVMGGLVAAAAAAVVIGGFAGACSLSSDEALPPAESSGGMWPQSSLEEVKEAQERADADDPRFTWQVEPNLEGHFDDGEIFAGCEAKRSRVDSGLVGSGPRSGTYRMWLG